MGLYDDMRGVTSEIMAEFKQGTVQYVPVTAAAGAAPDESADPVDGTLVIINATVRPVSTKYVDGSNILQSDKQVVMPNDGTTPTMTGMIRIDGVDHRIIQIMAYPAAGEPISFILIVRV